MNLASFLPDLDDVPEPLLNEAISDSFRTWVRSRGITLFPAQDEAILATEAGDNVIVATPTGSGKSLVALYAHFFALAHRQRTFYTAPIKALVNEKFFSLCHAFGAENVGMMTGDATVNGNAPIICATAEIVANIALRDGADAPIDQVVMDEFHYYSEPQRGWAWQVPLLELPRTQFILMSATLGDTTFLRKDLSNRTGRDTDLVEGSQRPVPLSFSYAYTPIHETIDSLLQDHKAPIYIVHFSQRDAADRAQALRGHIAISPERKEQIRAEIGSFRFSSAFGRQLSSLVRQGIGVHHAGMLPKYRRLVEKLAQAGLLTVICGTDTLGVGINVPIRTVLFSGLAKYDGQRHRVLRSREFHQIAGRAGRAGFDTEGFVIIEAPEHEIENYQARQKAGSDPKKLKKLRKKSAPEGRATWAESTYKRLVNAEPEQMTSQFTVSSSMLLNVLSRPGNGFVAMHRLLRGSHETRSKQNRHIHTAIDLFRGLRQAGIIEHSDGPDDTGRYCHVTDELQRDFALNQPLSPFAVAALDILDPESETFTLDIISVMESILDDPGPLLRAQEKKERGEEIAALKAEGVDYTERMARVEEITWPMPLKEELDEAFETYADGHPWAREFSLSPKSVVRHMIERAMNFSDLIATYGLAKSEGVILRYLTDAWRTLLNTVPADYHTDELDEIIDWLSELIIQVDSSLLDEWNRMADPDTPISDHEIEERAFGGGAPTALTANKRAFTRMVRNVFFRFVELFAFEKERELDELTDRITLDDVRGTPDWSSALDNYFDTFADLGVDASARSADMIIINEEARSWSVRQIIDDPDGNHDWAITGTVDLDASDEDGDVRLSCLSIVEGC
ncbi:DEAD/DEAH box helicase [Corynebacterium kroppenstedtii]|uniref:DEAD/DEAH box helicase n=1 Tax=Corynebacterium sp. PCR 32 TaxID=3351342 RepID=UPI00309CA60D